MIPGSLLVPPLMLDLCCVDVAHKLPGDVRCREQERDEQVWRAEGLQDHALYVFFVRHYIIS